MLIQYFERPSPAQSLRYAYVCTSWASQLIAHMWSHVYTRL
jgi:hypothetical protein